MATVKPITIDGFPKGMSNIGAPYALTEGACRNAVNVDFDEAGKPRRRKGSTLAYPGADIDSLWGNGSVTLFREGTALKQLARSGAGVYSARVVRGGLVAGYPIAYLDLNGEVYYTNGLITGKITQGVDGPWGVERPARQPVLTAVSYGGMHAGEYQVAITYRAASGEESGTGLAASVTVPAGGGIGLSEIPPPRDAATISVYCSMANGDVLYWYGDYLAGTTSLVLAAFQSDVRLETQFGYPPPPGQCLAAHNGRIYIAAGTVLMYTDALRYGLYRPHTNFHPFSHEITMHAVVNDGLYVATEEETAFLGGIDTEGAYRKVVLPYGAARADAVKIPKTSLIGWFSHRGWVVAGPGGEVKNVMEEHNAVSRFRRGATLFREQNGIRQLVAVLQDGEISALPAQDYIDYETARRGSAT